MTTPWHRLWLALCAVAMIACGASPAPPVVTVAGVTGPLAELSWLTGSWASTGEDELVEEHWTAPTTNLMLGLNRTSDGGTTRHHEVLRIEARPDGIYYVASPSGQATTAFEMVEHGRFFAVFENPAHDYPRRITYRRDGQWLTVRIEGENGSKPAEWRWRRSALPAE